LSEEQFGRYEIWAEIGRGGMATVFLAYDPFFEREVAIKVLPPELLHDPAFQARFRREAKTVASLEHPAIVPVYDFGEEQGQLFLVMRYLPGGSLADQLRKGPLSLASAARIISRLATGLDESHQRGIIHRDLKPANILFDQRGDAYLSDFGIVKLAQSNTTLTGKGVVGTPAYMSPEQARGDTNIDGRSDIYSLGSILFEMLTGQLPYEAETPTGQLIKHLTEPVPSILRRRPDLPPACEEIIARAMAKLPSARYATAGELAQAMAAVAQPETFPARPAAVKTEIAAPNRPAAPARVPRPAAEPARTPGWSSPPVVREQNLLAQLRERASPPVLYGLLALLILFGLGFSAVTLASILRPRTPPAERPGVVTTAAPVTASPASTTPLGEALEVNGLAQMQISDQGPVVLQAGALIPAALPVRLWTETGTVKIGLPGQSGFLLAEDSTVSVPSGGSGAAETLALILESGRVLVYGDRPAVRSSDGLEARASQAAMGVLFDPAGGKFQVACLTGACQVEQLNLDAGQQVEFEGGDLAGIQPLEYEPWLPLGKDYIVLPSETPSPTSTQPPTQPPSPAATDTSTPEATMTPSATPSRTLAPAPPTATPKPRKSERGGGNGSGDKTDIPPPPEDPTEPPPPPPA
jgi:serine/threonine protein kinase